MKTGKSHRTKRSKSNRKLPLELYILHTRVLRLLCLLTVRTFSLSLRKMPSMNIMMRMMQKKNKMIEDAKEAVRIKEEEEITKRNVKTIMDVEAAQLEREKLQENRYCL